MTLDEAIKTLRVIHDDINVRQADDDLDALNLGIEALKRIQFLQDPRHKPKEPPLPRETLKKLRESPLGRPPRG